MAAIDSLRAVGSPHSVRCPAATARQHAALTGVFETTIRKTDKSSAVAADDWQESGADEIKLRLELSDGLAVITEYYPVQSTDTTIRTRAHTGVPFP